MRLFKKKLNIFYSTIALVTIILIIIYSLSLNSSKDEEYQDEPDSIVGELVQTIVEKNISTGLTLTGKIFPNNNSVIKIDPDRGTIKEVYIKEGDFVEKGQKLFTYQTEQERSLKEAELNLEIQVRSVEVAKSTAGIKWGTYNKKVKELEKAKSNYSKDNTEDLKNIVDSLQEEVNQAYLDGISGDNAIKDAESELKKAEFVKNSEYDKLKFDTITAETDGYIKTLNIDLINQSKDNKMKENFIEILDRSSIYVEGNVNEFDREKISINQSVELIDRNNNENRWKGKIVQVAGLTTDDGVEESSQEENPNLSKFPFKVLINEEEKMPTIGSHVFVNVLKEGIDGKNIVVDREYILSIDDKQFVWKVVEKKVVLHEVKGESFGENQINITDGLSLEDTIVLPREGIEEGMEVD